MAGKSEDETFMTYFSKVYALECCVNWLQMNFYM